MRYHNILKDNMLNGEGLRCVLFVSGCDHFCKGCQNPCTWNPDVGLLFDESAKQEIFEQMEQSYIHGFTFCGGDPLFHKNIPECTEFAKLLKERYPDKTVWLYTGDVYEDIKDYEILNYLDVLIDGSFIEELADENYPWAGSTNQRVIDMNKTRATGEVTLYKIEVSNTDKYFREPIEKTNKCDS